MFYSTNLYYIYYIKSYIILLLIQNLLRDNNGKVKLERSRLWQLDNSRIKACKRG